METQELEIVDELLAIVMCRQQVRRDAFRGTEQTGEVERGDGALTEQERKAQGMHLQQLRAPADLRRYSTNAEDPGLRRQRI